MFAGRDRQGLFDGLSIDSMDPVTHTAFAYLLYVLYAGVRRVWATDGVRIPAKWGLIPIGFGSQFPDLIDKPLAYWDVLVYGRSLAHSVFSFAIVCVSLWWVLDVNPRGVVSWMSRRLRVITPAAFAIGYGSHLIGDAYQGLMAGAWFDVRFLVYPLYGVPRSAADQVSPWARILEMYREPAAAMHLEIVVGAVIVFVAVRLVSVWQTA